MRSYAWNGVGQVRDQGIRKELPQFGLLGKPGSNRDWVAMGRVLPDRTWINYRGL